MDNTHMRTPAGSIVKIENFPPLDGLFKLHLGEGGYRDGK